ncbi:hypothetical protein A33M_3406 [Rhodovulum sp. PH10]|uniref:hypothetical protein n=1 Tax=Rhodovulum sp. PH10 TaxID=1187851 RepID=UPI00027C2A83|nr:hypothetical protein [Rhodovulum sp. PH10]EJW11145.1 hypothetical protein A33M_3406 [Rhodovulum sp. PH10]
MRLSLVLPLAALLGLPGIALAAEEVPSFDVRPSCRGGSDTKAALDACLRQEDAAHDKLRSVWADYPAKARSGCVGQMDRELQSYVELLTCLQMSKDLDTLQDQDDGLGPEQSVEK